MVMLFKSKKALNFLLTHGEVYTLRPKRRKKEGREWITDRRGGRKIADADVELVAFVDLDRNYAETYKPQSFDSAEDLLKSYVPKSGFSTVEEWLNEGCKLFGRRLSRFYVYHVRLRRVTP